MHVATCPPVQQKIYNSVIRFPCGIAVITQIEIRTTNHLLMPEIIIVQMLRDILGLSFFLLLRYYHSESGSTGEAGLI